MKIIKNSVWIYSNSKFFKYFTRQSKTDISSIFFLQIEDMISPSEKTLLTKVHNMSDKLTKGQMQVDETILILETYLKYLMMK